MVLSFSFQTPNNSIDIDLRIKFDIEIYDVTIDVFYDLLGCLFKFVIIDLTNYPNLIFQIAVDVDLSSLQNVIFWYTMIHNIKCCTY